MDFLGQTTNYKREYNQVWMTLIHSLFKYMFNITEKIKLKINNNINIQYTPILLLIKSNQLKY